jgi:hypothetical protein
MPTCLEVAGVPLPATSKAGTPPVPIDGKSLVSVFEGRNSEEQSLFWEHEGNSAVREGKWKLVSRFPELCDMESDRTGLRNIADEHPDQVNKIAADYAAWAKRAGVQPWPMPETPAGPIREGAMSSPEYLLKDLGDSGEEVVLQVSRVDKERTVAGWPMCPSGREIKQSLDESVLLSDIFPAYSSDLTLTPSGLTAREREARIP